MKLLKIDLEAFKGMADITEEVQKYVEQSPVASGAVLVFVKGSTGAVTTIEYEPGLLKDFPEAMDKIAPYGKDYEHHKTWGDDNGSSHVKASIIGPSLVVPFVQKRLLLGRWQQIVVINFDTRPRTREVYLMILPTIQED